MQAALAGNPDLVKKLIREGADVNEQIGHDQPHWGSTPLRYSIEGGSLRVVQLLIKAGADVNEATDTNGIPNKKGDADNVRNNTLLSYAIMLRRPDMVVELIKGGADVNKRDPVYQAWTPLMIAAYLGNETIVSILIQAGADINAVNKLSDRTAIDYAHQQGHWRIVRLLEKTDQPITSRLTFPIIFLFTTFLIIFGMAIFYKK